MTIRCVDRDARNLDIRRLRNFEQSFHRSFLIVAIYSTATFTTY